MGEKLTKADVKKIEEEIEHRKLVLRPELIQAVKEARAQGDLSENFEYYAAKREKNRNESRIGYLERMLKFATIIEDRAAADEVGLNKMVEVYFVDEDESERYKVVTSQTPRVTVPLSESVFFRMKPAMHMSSFSPVKSISSVMYLWTARKPSGP